MENEYALEIMSRERIAEMRATGNLLLVVRGILW
jgi:hypothetical protein